MYDYLIGTLRTGHVLTVTESATARGRIKDDLHRREYFDDCTRMAQLADGAARKNYLEEQELGGPAVKAQDSEPMTGTRGSSSSPAG